MKKLIKLVLLIIVLAVLAFSQNSVISKPRNYLKSVFVKSDADKMVDKVVDATSDAAEAIGDVTKDAIDSIK